jgi:hypothetical protein
VADRGVLQSPVRRRPDQRAHHVRGVHGRWRVDRAGAYKPQSGATGGDDERADTDVFAAVRSEQPAATEAAEWPQEQSSAVATAEREDYQAPTAYSHEAETTEAVSPAGEEETKKIARPPAGTEKTEALPAHEPATEHIEKPKADD